MTTSKEISKFSIWIMASRPKTLFAAVSPVLVGWGIAVSLHQFHWFPALLALFCAVFIQIGTNMINDVVDFLKGTDTQDRLGPTRVTHAGYLSPKQVWMGVGVAFGLAAICGFILFLQSGWVVLLIGALSFLMGYFYTAGPSPLVNNGFGDLFVLIFFGFVAVMGTVFVTAGQVPAISWWAGAAVGFLVTAILVVNNIRDIESDKKAGRVNIPVVFGRKVGELEYLILCLAAYIIPVILYFAGLANVWIFLTFLSLPYVIVVYRKMLDLPAGRTFNQILAKTSLLTFLYSCLFTVGMLLQ